MNTKTHICKNGLKVFTNNNTTNPLVSIQFCIESGSIHENEFLGSGMSHLIEHMVFKGTKEFDCKQLAEETAKFGGMWNAYTTTDKTVFYITGPSEYYKEFIHILTQLVFFPTFPKEEFEREKDVIRREMDLCKDNIGHFAYFSLMAAVYNKNNKKYPVIGYRNRFDNITHKDMVNYHKKHYVPSNAFICVAGDIDHDKVIATIESEVDSIKAKELIKPVQEVDGYSMVHKTVTKTFNKPTTTVIYAWNIPNVKDEKYVYMYIMANIIGDGETSPLYTKFHDELNLVHSIEAYVFPSSYDCGLFVIEAEVDEYKVSEFDNAFVKYIVFDKKHLKEISSDAVNQFADRYKLNKLNKEKCVEKVASDILNNYTLYRDPNFDIALDKIIFNNVHLASKIRLAEKEYFNFSYTNLVIEPKKDVINKPEDNDGAIVGTFKETLSNGAKVVILRNSKKKTTDFSIAFKAGCRTETENTAGINNLMTSLMLKGTSNRSLKTIARDINKLGDLHYYSGQNTISFSFSCLMEHTADMVKLLSDVILNSTFSEDYLENEKHSIFASIDYYKTVPKVLARNRLLQSCYSGQTYGIPSTGSKASVAFLLREDILRHAKNIFCGDNAYICVSTAFPHTDVIRLLEKQFEHMEKGEVPNLNKTCAFTPGESEYSCNKEQAVIAVGFNGCNATSPELACVYIFEAWLKDMSGPLFTEVREKRGLAYHTTVETFFGTDAGYIIFYVITSNENLAKANDTLNSVIQSLITNGMSEEEFNKAKLLVKSSIASGNQLNSNIVKLASIDMANGNSYDRTMNFANEIDKVTLEDVNNFMKNKLKEPNNKVTITSSNN